MGALGVRDQSLEEAARWREKKDGCRRASESRVQTGLWDPQSGASQAAAEVSQAPEMSGMLECGSKDPEHPGETRGRLWGRRG